MAAAAAAAGSSGGGAAADPVFESEFYNDTRRVFIAESRLVGEKNIRRRPHDVSDAEINWHLVRLRQPCTSHPDPACEFPPTEDAMALLIVALSDREAWGLLARTMKWLTHHARRNSVKWRVSHMFCGRLPVIVSTPDQTSQNVLLKKSMRRTMGGMAHGIMVKKFNNRRARNRKVVEVYYGGNLANLGIVPSHISWEKISRDEMAVKIRFGESAPSLQLGVGLFYNNPLKSIHYREDVSRYCSDCKDAKRNSQNAIGNLIITYKNNRKKRYNFACLTCGYFNYRFTGKSHSDWRVLGSNNNILFPKCIPRFTEGEKDLSVRRIVSILENTISNPNFALKQLPWKPRRVMSDEAKAAAAEKRKATIKAKAKKDIRKKKRARK